MAYSTTTTFSAVVALLSFLAICPASAETTSGLAPTYCSSDNTGSSDGARFWTWQSNGWCHDQCVDNWAFAVIQGNNCWCSNYAPADQTSTSDCSDTCPGFPAEQCGNKAKNLFVYIALDHSPSGTQGASQPTSASVSTPSSFATSSADPSSTETDPSPAPPSPVSSQVISTPDPETVIHTVTASGAVVTITPSSDTPSSTPPLTTSSSTTQTKPPTTAASVTSVQIRTVSGAVITETIVTSPASTGAPLETTPKKSSHVGPIVGGVLGGIIALAAIAALLFFFLKWRRDRAHDEDGEYAQDAGGRDDKNGVHRNVSTMSKAGLLRREKIPQYPPPIATTFANSKRSSRHIDTESVSPISTSDRRSSRPYIFDQRLNPSAIMVLNNDSRGSFASLDDSRDYGRELNVRNPDPPRDSVDVRPSTLRN